MSELSLSARMVLARIRAENTAAQRARPSSRAAAGKVDTKDRRWTAEGSSIDVERWTATGERWRPGDGEAFDNDNCTGGYDNDGYLDHGD